MPADRSDQSQNAVDQQNPIKFFVTAFSYPSIYGEAVMQTAAAGPFA
jgi:hypothetical protein